MSTSEFAEELARQRRYYAGYWGVLPTGSVRPNTLGWYHDDQCDWVRGLNRRILVG